MNRKRLALTKDGKITYCSATDGNINKGRCNHIEHQKPLEDVNSFLDRVDQSKNKSLSTSGTNIHTETTIENQNTTHCQTEEILDDISMYDIFDIQSMLDNRNPWKGIAF